MKPLSTSFQRSDSFSMTRLSPKNSFKYCRTDSGVAASGVPRLTRSTPMPEDGAAATSLAGGAGSLARAGDGAGASVGDGAIGGTDSDAGAGAPSGAVAGAAIGASADDVSTDTASADDASADDTSRDCAAETAGSCAIGGGSAASLAFSGVDGASFIAKA